MPYTIDELPDLPGIEEEETGHTSSAFCFGCVGIIILPILFQILGYGDIWFFLIIPIASITALIQWLLGGNVRTNTDGLSYYRPYRGQDIRWTDVTDTRIATDKRGRNTVEISDNKRVVSIPINGNDHPRIIASIWQHLRKNNKAGNFILSDTVLSMWAEISSDIPEEMDYIEKSQDKSNSRTIYRLRQDSISQEIVGASEKEIKKMSEGKNPRITYWTEVTDVSWDYDNNEDGLTLVLDDPTDSEVYLYSPRNNDGTYDIDNARFLLAVVRRARKAIDKPIPIPEWLRDTCRIQLPGRQ